MNHNSHHQSVLTLREPQQHAHLGCNQELSDWIYGFLDQREIVPDKGNLANFSGLVNSQVSEKQLQLPLHQTEINPKINFNICSYTHR